MPSIRKHRFRLVMSLLILGLLLVAYGHWALNRPLPAVQPLQARSTLTAETPPSHLSWPANGQAAAGMVGQPKVLVNGEQTPLPTASVAKVLTALCVLERRPLRLGDEGPLITLNDADAALYNTYAAEDGSIVPVNVGEQISEYQMLEAMLLPSANNMADSLAVWAFGSLPAYRAYATGYTHRHGLEHTRVGTDASGFDPSTTSTSEDLVRLGELAMQNPVLAQIVAKKSADDVPLTASIENVNFLLGTEGIVGIKTGNTDQAGGVYLAASQARINGEAVTIVTAVMGADTLGQAMQSSLPLIASAQQNFGPASVMQKDAIIGYYQQPWGGKLAAAAAQDLTLQTWKGSTIHAEVTLRPITPHAHAGQDVGTIQIDVPDQKQILSVPVRLVHGPTQPSAWWRLTHPLR